MFFPVATPEYITTLLSVLQDMKFPFIFALGGVMAKNAIPASTIESANSSGSGLILTSWVDQRGILQHPSTGWFLTHAGWNSVSEALVQGKPMICWPISHGDQFMDSAVLSTRDEPLAFELLQTRMGDARGPPRRGGGAISGKLEDVEREFRDVFKKAKGREGEVVRGNVEAMASRLREERDDGADGVIRELAAV
jgi:UDP-glucoronosyl and UDP-glucosyl transferase